MELTQHIENYKNTLNKTQQKQFNKILDILSHQMDWSQQNQIWKHTR